MSSSNKKSKKIIPETMDIFAVPLLDGSFGLVHLCNVRRLGSRSFSVTSGFFDHRATSIDAMRHELDWYDLTRPFAVATITEHAIRGGEWTRLGNRFAEYAALNVKEHLQPPWDWFDGGERDPDWILDMFHGLYPWDGFYDPCYLDKLLTPGTTRPPSARLRKDFSDEELRELGVI